MVNDEVAVTGVPRRRARAWAVVAAAVLVVGGAGCGSSDSGDDGGSGDDTEQGSGGGATEADETAKDVTWGLNASQFQGDDGKTIAYECSEDGTIGSVWGTGTYTDDSSVCSAAVHAGIIDTEDGGRVVIEIAPGEDEYEGSEANGVTSLEYGSWPGSFTFPDAD